MKRYLSYTFVSVITLLTLLGCAKEEVYQSSIVRQFSLYLDGEHFQVNPGISTKPFFIYSRPSGDFVANYTSHYRFSLDNGAYWFIATPDPVGLIPDSVANTNIKNLIIKQFPKADKQVQISAATEYDSPFEQPLSLNMLSRTGTLRLKATDIRSDKSYTVVRTVVTVKRSGYKVIDETYIETPMDVTRSLNTDKGGVNYTDDFILFNTKDEQNGVDIRFELVDKNGAVVRTKKLSNPVPVLADSLTLVEFSLNESEDPMIQDYTVTVKEENWTEEQLNPEVPFRIPDGYTYVGPDEDINTVFNTLKDDNSLSEIKLYLKAGADYTFTSKTLNDVPKGFHILGQMPESGESAASLVMQGNISLGANVGTPVKLSAVHFENLNLKPSGDVFRFKNQDFEVQDILFKNCEFRDMPAPIWYQIADGDYMQVIQNFTIENCRFININLGSSGLLGLGNKQILPIYNIVFKNSTFHARTLGSAALITNLNKIDKTLSVTIQNCTMVNLAGGNMKFFDLNGANTSAFNLTVKNNLISGISTVGSGSWLVLNKVTNRDISNNFYTNGFALANWGILPGEEPQPTVLSMNDLFQDATSGDLLIKNKNSEVYTKQIGDPYWLQ